MNVETVYPEVALAFGERLRYWRAFTGWSQEYLAGEAGVHSTMVSRLERGLRCPSLAIAIRLADALGVSLDDLAGRQVPGRQMAVRP